MGVPEKRCHVTSMYILRKSNLKYNYQIIRNSRCVLIHVNSLKVMIRFESEREEDLALDGVSNCLRNSVLISHVLLSRLRSRFFCGLTAFSIPYTIVRFQPGTDLLFIQPFLMLWRDLSFRELLYMKLRFLYTSLAASWLLKTALSKTWLPIIPKRSESRISPSRVGGGIGSTVMTAPRRW